MNSALVCRELHKTYAARPPVHAVRGIDLEVGVGECFGVLGPNGAGKTTTIEILEGLLPASDGDVEVLGRRWGAEGQAIREHIGITLQETQFAEKLTVEETIRLFRSFYATGIAVETAIERVGLQEKSGADVHQLSGGQKQRLAVATGLVGDPELLFLDEPTTGLDPRSRRQLWDIIEDFKQRRRTVLLTTHYMDEAERLCDRVAIVDHGKVIALGSPRELIRGTGADQIIEFEVSGDLISASMLDDWRTLPDVKSVLKVSGRIEMAVTRVHTVLPAIFSGIEREGLNLGSLSTRHASLEDVFVGLTGRHLEETDGGGDEEPANKEAVHV